MKHLFTALGLFSAINAFSQLATTGWTITQNADFGVPNAAVKCMDAVDENVVWLLGGDGTNTALNYNWYSVTADGGDNFFSGNVFSDTSTYILGNIEGISDLTAWVSAYNKSTLLGGHVFRTADGGVNWTDMTSAGMYTTSVSFLNMVSFLTPSLGITVGDPIQGINPVTFEIWRTTNEGASWQQVPSANIPVSPYGEYGIVNIYAKYGPSHLWFGTDHGRIFKTMDAGANWQVSVVNPSCTISNIAFSDTSNGIAYALTDTVFSVYNTYDGGLTWNQLTPDPYMGRKSICAIPGRQMFASVGTDSTDTGIISYSEDIGYSWTRWNCYDWQYLTIDFGSENVGWAGAYSSSIDPSAEGVYKLDARSTVGVRKNSLNNQVSISPNPASSTLKITLPGEAIRSLKMYNVYGDLVLMQKIDASSGNSIPVDVKDYARGIYFMEVECTQGTVTKMIIIE